MAVLQTHLRSPLQLLCALPALVLVESDVMFLMLTASVEWLSEAGRGRLTAGALCTWGTGSDLTLHFLSTLQTRRTDAGVAASLSQWGGLSRKELSSLKDFTLQRRTREREGVLQTKHTPKTRKEKTSEIYCLALTDLPSCSA